MKNVQLTTIYLTTFAALMMFAGRIHAQKNQEFEKDLIGYELITDMTLQEYDMRNGAIDRKRKAIVKFGTLFYQIPDAITDTLKKTEGGIGDFYRIKIAPIKNLDSEGQMFVDAKGVLQTVDSQKSNGEEIFNYAEWFTRTFVYGVRKDTTTGENRIYRKYFCIKASDLVEGKVRKKYQTWKPLLSVGALAIPVKIRFGVNPDSSQHVPMDFTTDFTLGSTAGIKFRISKYDKNYLNLLGGIGITSVIADSTSTRGVVKESNSKLSAFTMTTGILAEFNGFQVGGFVGWDFVGRSVSKFGNSAWDYQGKPWIAIGMGYQIISRNDEKNGK